MHSDNVCQLKCYPERSVRLIHLRHITSIKFLYQRYNAGGLEVHAQARGQCGENPVRCPEQCAPGEQDRREQRDIDSSASLVVEFLILEQSNYRIA